MAAAARSFAKKAIEESYRGRGIRVLVYPTPITFAERRSVLQVLEQYGPIETFRMTPGYHSNFVSATRDKGTASKLLEASPLSYFVSSTHDAESIAALDLTAPRSFESIKPTTIMGATAASGESTSSGNMNNQQQAFTLEIYPLEANYRHLSSSEGMASHSEWPASYRKKDSFMATTLRQAIPNSIAAAGLTSWDNDPSDKNGQLSLKDRRLRTRDYSPRFMKHGKTDDEADEPIDRTHKPQYKAK